MTSATQLSEIGQTFVTALRTRDGTLLHSIAHADVVWSLPGRSVVSGEARGIDAVVARAATLGRYGLAFSLTHLLVGHSGVALSLHNTARRGDLVFDEHLATVLTIDDGRVRSMATYLSDIPMLDAFFVSVA